MQSGETIEDGIDYDPFDSYSKHLSSLLANLSLMNIFLYRRVTIVAANDSHLPGRRVMLG